jgi:hypothetical protein
MYAGEPEVTYSRPPVPPRNPGRNAWPEASDRRRLAGHQIEGGLGARDAAALAGHRGVNRW